MAFGLEHGRGLFFAGRLSAALAIRNLDALGGLNCQGWAFQVTTQSLTALGKPLTAESKTLEIEIPEKAWLALTPPCNRTSKRESGRNMKKYEDP